MINRPNSHGAGAQVIQFLAKVKKARNNPDLLDANAHLPDNMEALITIEIYFRELARSCYQHPNIQEIAHRKEELATWKQRLEVLKASHPFIAKAITENTDVRVWIRCIQARLDPATSQEDSYFYHFIVSHYFQKDDTLSWNLPNHIIPKNDFEKSALRLLVHRYYRAWCSIFHSEDLNSDDNDVLEALGHWIWTQASKNGDPPSRTHYAMLYHFFNPQSPSESPALPLALFSIFLLNFLSQAPVDVKGFFELIEEILRP